MNNANSNMKPNHSRSFHDQCNKSLLFSRKKKPTSRTMYKIIVQEQLQSICSPQL